MRTIKRIITEHIKDKNKKYKFEFGSDVVGYTFFN